MKIRILEVDSTIRDEIMKPLIGTVWEAKLYREYVVIDVCGGVTLAPDEYEIVEEG